MLHTRSRRRWLAAALVAANCVCGIGTGLQAQENLSPGVPAEPLSPIVNSTSEPLAESAPAEVITPEQATCDPNSPFGSGGGRGGLLAGRRNGASPCRDWGYGNPDLFYNYYVPPTCGGVGAYLYTSPGPIPAHVGHTYITYQPLMPHEFLYPHHRTYHRYYDEGRGFTRACVGYYNPPVRQAAKGFHEIIRLPR